MGFGVIGAEVIIISICNSIQLQFQLDVFQFGF